MKTSHFLGLSALAILLSATTGARATTIGTQSFNADSGVITANTGDVTTATIFTFSNFQTTGNQTGLFTGLSAQAFGGVTLDITSTGFDFGNSIFGTFMSQSVTPISIMAPFANFAEKGTFTAGSFFGANAGVTFPAMYAISFTQVGGPGTAISFSGTLAISPAATVIPEPSSIALVLTGLIGGVVMFGLRRRRSNLVSPGFPAF